MLNTFFADFIICSNGSVRISPKKIISKAKENQIRPPSSNPLFRLRFLKSHKTNQKLCPGRLDFMPTKLKLVWAFCGLWKPALIHFSAFSNSLFYFFLLQSVCCNSLSLSKLSSICVWYGHFRAFRLKFKILRMIFFNVGKIQLSLCRKGGGAGVGLLLIILHQTSSNLILMMTMMLLFILILIFITLYFIISPQWEIWKKCCRAIS